MSRRGKHEIAFQSGHHVQIEQPDVVIRAIEEVLAAARQGPFNDLHARACPQAHGT